MWINDGLFYIIFKEHPDWFPNWKDEGNQIRNNETGEIITGDEDSISNSYSDYEKTHLPTAIIGGPQKYKVTLSEDSSFENLTTQNPKSSNVVPIYKGKDVVSGYYVYGPLTRSNGRCYIDDIEAGRVSVIPETLEIDSERVNNG